MHARKMLGFTIIELMIAVGIIAILSAIAIPAYQSYMVRGKLTEGISTLSSLQTRMEQYYQDNRIYGPAGGTTCGITASATQYFGTPSCVTSNSGQNYTYTATSTSLGITYTVNDAGTKATTVVPSGWTANATCWVRDKSGSC